MKNLNLNNIKVLALDPSGNFEQGKGITGATWATIDLETKEFFEIKSFEIRAEEFKTQKEYFDSIVGLTASFDLVVCEDFDLDRNKATKLGGSKMETSQLIGVLKNQLPEQKLHMQPRSIKSAALPKHLEQDGLIKIVGKHHKLREQILSVHQLDSMRHLYWFTWHNKLNT